MSPFPNLPNESHKVKPCFIYAITKVQKPVFVYAITKVQKQAAQLPISAFCFRYIESTIRLLSKSEILRL